MAVQTSIVNTGVSGGNAFTGQGTGVPLQVVNDYAVLFPSAAAPGAGPDTQGTIVISPGNLGGYSAGAQVAFEEALTVAAFNSNIWLPIPGWIPFQSGQPLPVNTYTLTASQTLTLTLPQVQGFYALRVRLIVAQLVGAVVVSGTSFPVSGAFTPVEAALIQQNTYLNTVAALAACDQSGQDYFAAALNFTYP
jgi:hypothetical protein